MLHKIKGEWGGWVATLIVFVVLLGKESSAALLWDQAACAPDADPTVSEGVIPNIGRFPWLGIIQHNFYMGDKSRFAVTTAVLIHPTFVIAPADDIARIPPQTLRNNTKYIVWYSPEIKFVLDVKDYSVHPEYTEGTTKSSIALLEIITEGKIGLSHVATPILPVCMSFSGIGTFTDLHAIRLNEVKGEIYKESFRMNYVENKDCEEFYYKAQLTSRYQRPTSFICVVSESQTESCVWDAGLALVSRQAWGFWKLIGFGVRGPGCGAPSRFIYVADYMTWIDQIISLGEVIQEEGDDGLQKIYFRRHSPIELVMYAGDVKVPQEQGQCDRKERGGVLFKDSSEVLTNKNFVQGFYFVSVQQIAQFQCVVLHIEAQSRTNTGAWIDHMCHREVTGLSPGMKGQDDRKLECFTYFKSKAYVEIRFFFSFKVLLELTVYGTEATPVLIPNPFKTSETTEDWYPTDRYIRWGEFSPYGKWTWHL